jgi:hypothetical protein
MSTAIILSLVIPGIVAAILTGMLIQEREHFFHGKEYPTEEKPEQDREPWPGDESPLKHIDFSGGTLGI